MVEARCNDILGMDGAVIPTYTEWRRKKRIAEELDKMSVNDMLELYEGDPAAHFYRHSSPKSAYFGLFRASREQSRIGSNGH